MILASEIYPYELDKYGNDYWSQSFKSFFLAIQHLYVCDWVWLLVLANLVRTLPSTEKDFIYGNIFPSGQADFCNVPNSSNDTRTIYLLE